MRSVVCVVTAVFFHWLAGTGTVFAQAGQGGAGAAGGASYISGPIPDEEAVSVRVHADSNFPGPLVTMIDALGTESDCLLPCTLRTRVGGVTFEGPRLAVDVDLQAAGLTYDVALSAGSSGEEFALVTTFVVTSAAVLALGIAGLVLGPEDDDDLRAWSGLGAGYGGLAFAITLPWLIVLLVNMNGTSTATFSRGLSAALTPDGTAFAF